MDDALVVLTLAAFLLLCLKTAEFLDRMSR